MPVVMLVALVLAHTVWADAAPATVVTWKLGRDILPLIQHIPLSRLQRATGLSLRYVSLIRRGEKTPHPRHWQALRSLSD